MHWDKEQGGQLRHCRFRGFSKVVLLNLDWNVSEDGSSVHAAVTKPKTTNPPPVGKTAYASVGEIWIKRIGEALTNIPKKSASGRIGSVMLPWASAESSRRSADFQSVCIWPKSSPAATIFTTGRSAGRADSSGAPVCNRLWFQDPPVAHPSRLEIGAPGPSAYCRLVPVPPV